jgi:hypothetical protein
VSARQHARLHADRAHRVHVAPIDARLAGDDPAPHDVVFEAADLVADLRGIELRRVTARERCDDGLLDLADAGMTRLLLDMLKNLKLIENILKKEINAICDE